MYKRQGAVAADLTLSSVFRSTDGKIVGTPLYFSPEQQRGEALDERSDLYAVGIIFFECLTGSLPAGSEVPSEIVPSLPRSFDAFYKRLYARKEKRFPSAEKALEALTEIIAEAASDHEPFQGNSFPQAETRDREEFYESESEGVFEKEHVVGVRYAGVFARLFAHFVDLLILWLFLGCMIAGPVRFFLPVAFPLIHFLYTIFFVGAFGATPGKLIMGMRVRAEGGGPADFFQAFARYVVAVLSLGTTFLFCVLDRKKRGIHDMAAGTVVVWWD